MHAAVLDRAPDEFPGGGLPRILQAGAAACFLGHGALGLLRTAAWTPYFGVAGIGPATALRLMPWVGALDVILAISVVVYPARAVVGYMVAWTVWTALLRPLAGESGWEAVERAGNYGVPLALWWLGGGGRTVPSPEGPRRRGLNWILRLTTVGVLLGHGALGWIVQKPLFASHYALLGLPGATVEPLIGGFEGLLALAVLLRPTRRLLFGVVAWKLATESLSPLAGSPFWVFVEHGGSYAAPLALALLLPRSAPAHPDLAPAPASQPQASVRN
jgi:hypothetical protein